MLWSLGLINMPASLIVLACAHDLLCQSSASESLQFVRTAEYFLALVAGRGGDPPPALPWHESRAAAQPVVPAALGLPLGWRVITAPSSFRCQLREQ